MAKIRPKKSRAGKAEGLGTRGSSLRQAQSGERSRATSRYGAEQITVLEGLEPVRRRPAMYIGSTGPSGLHHLIWEVVDNSIDEAMAGFAKHIVVTLLPGNRVRGEDDGRGIPVERHKQTKKSALETALTYLHAGGKFERGAYKVSGGLHGVGVSVVNALSVYLKAEIRRDGKLWMQEYKRGKPLGSVKSVGKAQGTGTTITFDPDPEIFPDISWSWDTILSHLREQAYLTRGVRITVRDERQVAESALRVAGSTPSKPPATSHLAGATTYTFYFEGGIRSYVRYLNRRKEPKHDNVFAVDKETDGLAVEVAVQYTNDVTETIAAFANNIRTPEGGTHVVGFRTALTRVLNAYARKNGYLKEKDENLTGEDVREGLTAVISVKLKEPQFEGQTKSKLGNVEARGAVEQVFADAFAAYLEEHPRDAEGILAKCLLSAQARKAARQARESVLRKGVMDGLTLPGKLADCSSKDPQTSEIYLVEGDSAGGCFTGDTLVALADGRNISFEELLREWTEGKTNYCYTIQEDGRAGIAPIEHVRRTKRNAEIVKVVLDDGVEIRCTPDHRFMLREGSYRHAAQLLPGDSLMPFRRQYSRIGRRITIEGYEMVYDPAELRWIFTHLLADRYNLDHTRYAVSSGPHRHHRDGNKRNNNPDNIERLTKEAHLRYHRLHAQETLHRPETVAKLREIQKTPQYREKIRTAMTRPAMRRQLSLRATRQWQNLEYKQYMVEKYRAFYTSHPEYRESLFKRLYLTQQEYWGKQRHRQAQAERVQRYFESNPQARAIFSEKARAQWQNEALVVWRRAKTREQWTPEFRARRRASYNETYLRKTLAVLRRVYEATSEIDERAYNHERKRLNDRSIIRLDTICNRFFGGDLRKLREAVVHYNHRVKAVEPLALRADVYDFEVPGTHNFALSSGVFVHNSAKQGRDRTFQAILPLRGKILNVERSRLDKMLANDAIKSLIIALGANVGNDLDLARLRYHRVIIMTDADVDGSHIRTLLLTLFYRYFRPIIDAGYLYIAQPPLYRLQRGKEVSYAYTEEEKEKLMASHRRKEQSLSKGGARGKVKKEARATFESPESSVPGDGEVAPVDTVKGIVIQRYKGLGEMNPPQLWETTMDPARRHMKRVTIRNAQAADELFEILMGDEVLPRKHFIQTHALSVQNLDI